MKFIVLHESSNRMRIHVVQKEMSDREAETLLYFLRSQSFVTNVKVYERTNDAAIEYKGRRTQLIAALQHFCYDAVTPPQGLVENSGRALSREYQEKIVNQIVLHFTVKWFLPYPVRLVYTLFSAVRYVKKGLACLARKKIEVPLLDAAAISVSILRGDIDTAGSIMFMLGIGDLLEDWTHKKSVDDLARTMSLNVSKVWLIVPEKKNDSGNDDHPDEVEEASEVLVPVSQVKEKDLVVVHMGNVIPFDGVVQDGEAMVNQSSLTGEAIPVRKKKDGFVYAGTVVEEGGLTIQVKSTGGSSRYEKIVKMIEETEKLKSSVESNAEHLADRLVPYSLLGTVLVYLVSGNATRALSVLMVDYSCALKLAMPVSVLSAIREAGEHHLTVKGGKVLEEVAEADTIVFDKTGTLTKATPKVVDVVSFNDMSPDELLRISACLEEHFPHSMARAVVDAAKEKHLEHEEMHSKVEYIVAHGIASSIQGKRVVIGSWHFVFEDEKVKVPEGKEERLHTLPPEYSHLYLAMDGMLSAVICIEDPVKEEAKDALKALRKCGIKNMVMMTGDNEETARAIAEKVGVDGYYAEVLPEDKARYVEEEKAKGHKVIMVGDGINDSPALSVADVGIAMNDGAEIAREVADIMVGEDDLYELVTLKKLSCALIQRIHRNYQTIVGFNSMLIILGVAGVIQPTTSALLHNSSTLLIGVGSMANLLDEESLKR